MREIMSCLDIGSDSIKLVVGEIFNNDFYVLSSSKVKSSGIKDGIIVKGEEAVNGIKEAFRVCEEALNTSINKVLLVVSNRGASFIKNNGKINISETVKSSDISNVIKISANNMLTSDMQLVNIMPIWFKLDGKKVKNPLNLEGKILECECIISSVPRDNVYNIFKILDGLNKEIIDISLGGLSDYYEFKGEISDKYGAVINIGASSTSVSIINDSIMVSSSVIDVGGENIDKDICYMYNVSGDEARSLKEGFAYAGKVNADDNLNEEVVVNNKIVKINHYEISNIVYSRIKEILNLAKKEINLLTKREISYIIVVGCSSDATDFDLVIHEVFSKNIKVFKVSEIGCRSNGYSSCIGMIKYYREKLAFRGKNACTFTSNEEKEILNVKNKNSSILQKVRGYLFE